MTKRNHVATLPLVFHLTLKVKTFPAGGWKRTTITVPLFGDSYNNGGFKVLISGLWCPRSIIEELVL
ncbi:hypothetical protein ACLKA6_006634 [Drosophila palustris]